MRIAIYGRVSTSHQVEHQTIEQQLGRLVAHVGMHAAEGWALNPVHVFRDDGFSGAVLARPGLDRLRDAVKGHEVDRVLVTAPDRLARNYVHQMVLLEEWGRVGCATEFLDRPMRDDPHDHLLLQIRGAVAEYERTLIAERMRRGRLAKLRAGTLLPWTHAPYGYRMSPDRPLARAVARAHGGAWLPQELLARRETLRQGQTSLRQQLERLTDAYLRTVIPLDEYERRRRDIEQRVQALSGQEEQLRHDAARQQQLAGIAASLEGFRERVQASLTQASFEQRRQLVLLLVDRVIVTDADVEIRYVLPTSPDSEHVRFCRLRNCLVVRRPWHSRR
jgi:DNA invertase Pin-like site-specific DNA recombinase